MKIRENMLNALVSLNAAQEVLGKDAIHEAKKMWWENVRQEYGLNGGVKYKVVTVGENAGELRYKATGELVEANDGKFLIVFVDSHTRYATAEAAEAAVTETGEKVAQLV